MNLKTSRIANLFLLVFCTVLCGCQKTPQEVIERTEDYGKNEQITDEVEITYCKPSELRNTSLADVSVDMGNIELPDKVDFSKVEDVALLHLSYQSNFLADKDKYLKLFGIKKKTLVDTGSNHFGKYETYEGKKAKKGFNIGENGFISYYSGVTYDYIYGENNEGEELQVVLNDEYEIDSDDLSGVKIGFKDGETGLLDMCSKAEKWLETNMPVSQLKYHVSDAISKTVVYPKDKKENNLLSLCAELEYKGIGLNDHVVLTSDDTDKVITGFAVNINYDSPEDMSFFSNGKGTIKLDSAESLEKIVDFDSCVKIVKKTMADFNKLKIERVIPLYIIYSTSNDEKEDYVSGPG